MKEHRGDSWAQKIEAQQGSDGGGGVLCPETCGLENRFCPFLAELP